MDSLKFGAMPEYGNLILPENRKCAEELMLFHKSRYEEFEYVFKQVSKYAEISAWAQSAEKKTSPSFKRNGFEVEADALLNALRHPAAMPSADSLHYADWTCWKLPSAGFVRCNRQVSQRCQQLVTHCSKQVSRACNPSHFSSQFW